MSVGHVVSRSVRDSAAFLDATHGPAVGDPYCAPPFDASFLAGCGDAPRRLRIALDTHSLTDAPTHPDCIAAASHAAKLCESLGHRVQEASPHFDRLAFRTATSVVVSASIANLVDSRLGVLGRALRDDDIEDSTRATVEYGRSIAASRYAAAMLTIHQTGRAVARFHQTYDLMLTPTLVAPPVALGWLDTMSPDRTTFANRFSNFWGFTNLQNATGQPAISLPLYWNADHLPIGVQFVGCVGDELLLLQLASQLERAQPWFDRRPPKPGD
jgi:Asp-tRNA(Asn)/Glu-tRNA(Gln) amidotransferase A subunit family amidase